MAGTDLGLSLVDNPVTGESSAGDGSNGEQKLAVMPNQLHRVGDMLSAPDGAPTPLFKVLFAVLVGYPWCFAVGGIPPSPNGWKALISGDTAIDTGATSTAALLKRRGTPF